MSATTNLEIEKLNSADYVSVEPINNALDKLGVDYVTESGTAENANFGIYVCGKTN
jgi:hypothetical protein